MGIKDIGKHIRDNTKANIIIPYDTVAGEHIVCDGNEFIYKYVTVIFGNMKYDKLPDHVKSFDKLQIVDWIIAENWDHILRSMTAGVCRFSNSTYITFVMDGSDETGTIDHIDAIDGRFNMVRRLDEEEVIFDNYESSSDDEFEPFVIPEYDQITPVFVDSGNIVPSANTADLKTGTWEKRDKANAYNVNKIRTGKVKTLTGLFRMTSLAKRLIHDLVEQVDDMKLSVVYADGEGDFLIALYCSEGKAFGCMTRDNDQLAYGSDVQIIRADAKGLHVRYIPFILDDLDIDKEQLRTWCILLGVDYNTRIRGMGPIESLKVVKGLREPPSQKDLSMIAKFDECWDVFSSAQGYNYVKTMDYHASPQRIREKILQYM